MIDLANALGAVAERATAAASPLPVDRLVGRLHRTRTVRTATYSAIGLGAAAVVTVGAVAADGLIADRDPAPAPPATDEAGPTPDRTPAARPTPTPSATPTEAAWQPSWDLCGTPADDLLARDDSTPGDGGGWRLEAPWEHASNALNEPMTLKAVLFPPLFPRDAAEDVAARITDALVVEAGTGEVVAVADRPADDVTHGLATSEDGLSLAPTTFGFAACTASPLTGGSGSLAEPLPEAAAGTYWAITVAEITTGDGSVVTTLDFVGYVGASPEETAPGTEPSSPPRQPVTLTADTPLRLAVGETLNNRTDDFRVGDTWCGVSAPAAAPWLATTPTPGGPLALSATGFLADGELVLQLTTTNTGAAITGASALDPDITVVSPNGQVIDAAGGFVSHGQVIGRARDSSREFVTPSWATGAQTQLETSIGPFTCTFMYGTPWPTGTYEVYASQTVVIPEQAGYPGGRRDVVVGGPFTFTLE
jgi:hypothetical protein